MPIYDYKFLLVDNVDCLAANTNSTNEVDFGVANPNVAAGQEFGAHIVIKTTYTNLESGADIHVHHGAATAPTTRLISRRLTVAQMVADKHYFIPFPPTNLQFARLKFVPVSETSTNGALTAWFGPRSGGEL